MPKRRTSNRRSTTRPTRIAGAVGAIGQRLWSRAIDRPVDSAAILGAGALSMVIVVNAVFLQSGPHLAPFFANAAPLPRTAESRSDNIVGATPKAVEVPPARPAIGQRLPSPQPVSVRRSDPIGDLIGSAAGRSSRIIAVQRILAEFGYGQIKPSGVLDEATSTAIGKFESDHKLPVTGRLSDRFLNELATMAGHPVE